MTKPFRLAGLASLVLAACAHRPPVAPCVSAVPPAANWHRIVTPDDAARLRTWRDTWVAALARARAAPNGAETKADALFDPDRALPDGATPPPGRYRCRVYKLGANGPAMKDFTAYPAAPCTIGADGDVSRFALGDAAQRPSGRILPDMPGRAVFLGTLTLGDEKTPMPYGRDASRDMAGYVERVAPQRWRIDLPAPRFESQFDVIELVPA